MQVTTKITQNGLTLTVKYSSGITEIVFFAKSEMLALKSFLKLRGLTKF